MSRAVFLDRDGTIIEERNYLCRVDEVSLYPGAAAALARLCRAGFRLFVVTNQSGVGRGLFPLEDVFRVNQYLEELLRAEGVLIERFYVAPEAPDQASHGRKPSPRFLFDAREEFRVDLSRSYMVGDKLSDLACGWNAGVERSLLVQTGYGARTLAQHPDELQRAVIVADLAQAVDWILKGSPLL